MRKAVGTRDRFTCAGRCVALAIVLGWAYSNAAAQEVEVRIRYRPLSPQEIKDFQLPADTQKSGGSPNAGLGQPVYLEALITEGTEVNDVTWTLIAQPAGSTAAMEPGPLDLDVPTHDPGDRDGFVVVGRAMLKPDVISVWDFNTEEVVDYKIRTDVVTALGTLSFTNSVYGGTYIGKEPDNELCTICHAPQWESFEETGHSDVFIRQITGQGSSHFQEFCISCHATGYDLHPDAVNDGFDDIATQVGWEFPSELSVTNWTEMDPALQNKANVLCEACHGPAITHMYSLGEEEAIDVSLSSGNCGKCHDALTHHVKNIEWGRSGHGTGHYAHHYIGRNGCQNCHNGAGFVMAHDPDYADKDLRATGEEGITCSTCHDPHAPGDGPHQLRAMDGAPLGNGTVIMAGGDGIICMNCHQSRRDAREYVEDYESGTFRGPHHGPQADMIAGENAYEYGLDMASSDAHLHGIEHSCVTCHMQEIEDHSSPAHTEAGGHTWEMTWDNESPDNPEDDVHLVEACKECHGEVEDFNFGGEDWDRDGIVEGTQKEISDLVHMVEMLLPPGSPSNAGWSTEELGAYYNLHFVEEDGSHGVHNPKYAAALLQAAVGALTGGIDVDCDDLLDEWEMEHFGSLSAQTGTGDADGDGASNALEQSVGTDPTMVDSDNDTFSDLAELQAGSDPLDMTSVPSPNTIVQMIPATELGYMPGTPGVTQVFQAASSPGDTGWTDVGDPFVSGDSMEYQLISTKDATQQFYRVTEP